MVAGTTTKPLAKIRFGSHLYGTDTPASDVDFKSVHVPSASGILLGRPEDVLHFGTKANAAAPNTGYWSGTPRPNTSADVDHDSLSLAKLFGMLQDGDMNAIELLFAPDTCIDETSPEWDYITSPEIRKRLVDRKCAGFVGYCQGQATRYGVRASRIDSLTSLIEAVHSAAANHPHRLDARISECTDDLYRLLEGNPAAAWVRRDSGHTRDLLHISVCDRLAAVTEKMSQLLDIANGALRKYGRRSIAASASGGFDFRALSHAVRVGREAVELLTTSQITFPLASAEELIAIKTGRLPGPEVLKILDSTLTDLATASEKSALPENVDWDFCQATQMRIYAQQISNSGL